MLLNLTFASSIGNITLVQNLQYVANIQNYQVMGNYYSQGTVALLGANVNATTLIITSINFKPETFNVGNQSSYLVSMVEFSTVQIKDMSIIMGSSSQQQTANQIVSTYTNPYIFGGIFTTVISTSINIVQLIGDSYLTHNTNYVTSSGYLIGQSQVQSNIIIMNMCLSINNIQQQDENFGIIGYAQGNIQLTQISLFMSLQSKNFKRVGIIGFTSTSVMLIHISKIQSTICLNVIGSSSYGDVGTFGLIQSQQFQIFDSILEYNNNNYSSVSSGGLSGYLGNSIIKVYNIVILNSNIQSQKYCGGFVGYLIYSNIYINSAQIQQVHITSTELTYGIIAGYNIDTVYNIQQSKSVANYFNNVLQTDCLNIINTWSVTQC
ncbi:Hypothetical_protein [Hexamita inflata]|uniref:Hypothetical_protein n=1 Tax=Hexamita inflata TaxID=28002 RepID=A0AA86NGN2_9EUKA|nr:Hypothetical protein HINF_LOCUS7227 [Hexamita inflata]